MCSKVLSCPCLLTIQMTIITRTCPSYWELSTRLAGRVPATVLFPSIGTMFTAVPHYAHVITYCSPLPWYAMQVSMTSRVGSSSQRSYGMFPSELTASKSAPLQRKGQGERREGVSGLVWLLIHSPTTLPSSHDPTENSLLSDALSFPPHILGMQCFRIPGSQQERTKVSDERHQQKGTSRQMAKLSLVTLIEMI